MDTDRYDLRPFLMRFTNATVEREYAEHTLARSLWFLRGAWGLVAVLGLLFGLLDRQIFGAQAGTVLGLRVAVASLAVLVIAGSFSPRARPWMVYSSPLFVTVMGLFCTVLTALADPSAFTPFFTGLFFALAGILGTPGLGFRHCLWALLFNLLAFELILGVLIPVAPRLLLVYSFFLPGIVVVFGFAAYLVEHSARDQHVVAARLKDSLAEVKKLSGLLPTCASCKKIRDDQGHWTRFEVYVSARSEADFSHGLCPECAQTLYPELTAPPEDGETP